MKAQPFVCLALVHVLILPAGSRAADQRLVNGGLETFNAAGEPTGWSSGTSLTPGSIAQSTFVSPFPSPYGVSTRSVLMTDNDLNISTPSLSQSFARIDGGFALHYDFYLAGPVLSGNPWGVYGVSAPVNGTALGLFGIFMDFHGQFDVIDGSAGAQQTVTILNPATWYHVEVQCSFLTATYSGSIIPFGGVAASWNNLGLQTSNPQFMNLASLRFDDNNGVAAANSPFHLDNVNLVPVPEPGTWALLFGCVLILAGQLRRKH